MMTTAKRITVGAAALVMASGIALAADEKPTERSDRAAKQNAHPAASGVISPAKNDRRIARWLAIDNRMIVECSRMVEERGASEEVREFARMVAAEHERFQDVLDDHPDSNRSANREKNRTTDDDKTAAAPSKTATLIQDDGKSRAGSAYFQPTDFLAVKEAVCEEMRSKAKKEFEALDGAEFDHAYLSHIVFAHEALIATVDTVDDNATDALQASLKNFRESLDKHLKQARDLRSRDRQQDSAVKSDQTRTK